MVPAFGAAVRISEVINAPQGPAWHIRDAGTAVIFGMTAVGSCRELPVGSETPGLAPPLQIRNQRLAPT